jgi:hypothetical protein
MSGPWTCCCPTCAYFFDNFDSSISIIRLKPCGVDLSTYPYTLEDCTTHDPLDCLCPDGFACDEGEMCANPDVNPYHMAKLWDQENSTGEWWVVPTDMSSYPNTGMAGALAETTGTGRIMCQRGWPNKGFNLQCVTRFEQPHQEYVLNLLCTRSNQGGKVHLSVFLGDPNISEKSVVTVSDESGVLESREFMSSTLGSRRFSFSYDPEHEVLCVYVEGMTPECVLRVFTVTVTTEETNELFTSGKFSIENASGTVSGDPMPIVVDEVQYSGKYRYPDQSDTGLELECVGCVCNCEATQDGVNVETRIPRTIHLEITGSCTEKHCNPPEFDCAVTGEESISVSVDLKLVEDFQTIGDLWVPDADFTMCGIEGNTARYLCGGKGVLTLYTDDYGDLEFIIDEDLSTCRPFHWEGDYALPVNSGPVASPICCDICFGPTAFQCHTEGNLHAVITA